MAEPGSHVGQARDRSLEIIDFNDRNSGHRYEIGPYEHDLICGADGCSEVLIAGWTLVGARARFSADRAKAALCKCGAYSALPDRVNEPGTGPE
jgi:hypothetical protein